jgi:acid phosphatase (class A)
MSTKLNPRLLLRRCTVILTLALLTYALASRYADQTTYLQPGKPDFITSLAPPPQPGSPEQAADLSSTIAAYSARTKEDEALAKSEKHFSIFYFAPAIGPFFKPGTLPKTEALFERVQREADAIFTAAKKYWKRPRPYANEPSLSSVEPEWSYSYPSGHSTRATVYALLLAELFPEKSEGILAIGQAIGWHRVQIGKHYPTDVYAGRELAQAIVREMRASPEFQRDFAEVQKEIAALNQAH